MLKFTWVNRTIINSLRADGWHWLVTTYRVSRCYPLLHSPSRMFAITSVILLSCYQWCHQTDSASIISQQTEQTTSQLWVSHLQRNSQQRIIYDKEQISDFYWTYYHWHGLSCHLRLSGIKSWFRLFHHSPKQLGRVSNDMKHLTPDLKYSSVQLNRQLLLCVWK